MAILARVLAISVLLFPGISSAASSWWSNDWKFRKEITFDLSSAAANVPTSVQDAPILLRLSLANFSYFNDAKPDASDFRILAADDKTPLKFHFEKYDPQSQIALLWVRVPQLSGGAKTDKIFAYYGNPDAPAAGDVAGTYDASQVLVLSFSDTTPAPLDQTAYKNNPSSSSAVLNPASLIGGGAKFAGKESIVVPATASLRLLPSQGFTESAWVRLEQGQQATVLALTDGAKELSIGIEGLRIVARAAMGGAPVVVTQPNEITLNEWHHVALTAAAGRLTLYVDGSPAGNAPVELAEVAGSFTIGAANSAHYLNGEVDEVEAAKVARSADWLRASSRSQAIDGGLVVYGTDGQREGGGQTSYFVTIAKNLTVDGWVVIGICMAMLAISLLIMVVKALFLSRVEKANNRFMREFRHLGGDATALADPTAPGVDAMFVDRPSMASLSGDKSKFGASTLYQLYQHGVAELNKRVVGGTVSAQRVQVLSSQSIDAIRAAMDASMTRLQQSLASQMVLLTIAISGGPFLGLLGTVIGVMITFAAIALSGDVNINAIAPGTAAALAATVAGLAVAIPSLFGYNWLNTRIKAISADNRVFVDEFVTRVAEQYS